MSFMEGPINSEGMNGKFRSSGKFENDFVYLASYRASLNEPSGS